VDVVFPLGHSNQVVYFPVTLLAQRYSVIDIKAKFWIVSKWFDVMSVQPFAMLPAHLTGVIVAIKYGSTPCEIRASTSDDPSLGDSSALPT
jgi:hypothetical protein